LAAELRWVLLGLSLPLLAGIWWWTARRTRQAPGNAELRESTPPLDPRHSDLGSDADGESEGESDGEEMRAAPEPRDWGVPPFEPLSIRTANFDGVPTLDGPMMVGAEPARAPSSAPAPPSATAQPSASVIAAASSSVPPAARPAFLTGSTVENSDRLAAVAPHAPNTAEMQRIVTVRVCAVGETRWPGVDLLAALELHGLAFGRYQVFHRKHVDGRSLFCVASLVEPGTFDVAEMPVQEFRGVTLFAVLPGPIVPLETVDELLRTARGLAEELSGTVQDAKGMPLSPQRAAAVREDVARFQASLSGN
jgi:cell division protein ZipA